MVGSTIVVEIFLYRKLFVGKADEKKIVKRTDFFAETRNKSESEIFQRTFLGVQFTDAEKNRRHFLSENFYFHLKMVGEYSPGWIIVRTDKHSYF